MASGPTRLSSSYTSTKSLNLSDVLQTFYTRVENVKQTHQNEMEVLTKKVRDLETENRHLRLSHEQHPHSIFDIDYVANDSSATIDQLRSELDRAQKQIDVLQTTLNQQYSEYEDMKSKYSLQRLMNENRFEQNNSHPSDGAKLKELEGQLKQIKDQINQFDQCHYESEEQIRLLKQLLLNNDQESMKSISQSLTVKQSDLSQQTLVVENLLNKQHEKILNQIMKLIDRNPRSDQQTTTTAAATTKKKRTKRKRL